MRTLLVMRHGKSSWKEAGISDHDRPLNERGRRDAPRMGKLLAAKSLVPDAIICSTAKRARKTAQKVARACGYRGSIIEQRALYLAATAGIVELLTQLEDEPACVLIVGHNPGMEYLVRCLTDQSCNMATGAIAHLELPIDNWSQLRLQPQAQWPHFWLPREV